MNGKAARSFEELHIYQRAQELTNEIYALTRGGEFSRDFGLVDQIRRASVSVMSNVAEGFERGTSVAFVQFLFIAKGSCGEVRAQLQVAADQGYIDKESHIKLNNLARPIRGMISNFIAHLQKSDYRGEKFNRPQRHSIEAHRLAQEQLREAQLRNMRPREQSNPTSALSNP